MLAAFEASVRRSCKDEAEWRRRHGEIYAEPREVRDARRAAALSGSRAAEPQRMSVDAAEAMLARFAASDSMYGAG